MTQEQRNVARFNLKGSENGKDGGIDGEGKEF